MSTYAATIRWKRGSEGDFAKGQYSRAHEWAFDGGHVMPASASPHVVPAPWSDPAGVDPEEALMLRVAERVEEDAHAAALERARALAQLPTDPYAVTKLNLRGAAAESARSRITAETEQFIQAMASRR